jgi:hypothetical protein
MPWKVVKDKARCGSGFALVNSETNDLVACHRSKKGAAAQQRALYAATAKETKKADMPMPEMDMAAEQADEWDSLTDRQQELAESYFENVLEYGMFDQSSKANGAHYAPAAVNPFKATGMVCQNCVFFADSANQCMIVMGEIEPEAICKLWVIPEDMIVEPTAKSDSIWAGRFISKLN